MRYFHIIILLVTQLPTVQHMSAQIIEPCETDRSVRLLQLAKNKFCGKLSKADIKLFVETANGRLAKYGEGDPTEAYKWDADRHLNADRIEWLCTDREARKEISYKGIKICGAYIDARLDLSFVRFDFPLSIVNSVIPEVIDIRHSQMYTFSLSGTHTGPILGNDITVEKSVFLNDGFHANGEVNLINSTIGGNLDCTDGKFHHMDGNYITLNAKGINIKGSMLLNSGFTSRGEVSLVGGTIDSNLECRSSRFINKGGFVLDARDIHVKNNVFLGSYFHPWGDIVFSNAIIKGIFILDPLVTDHKYRLRLDYAKIGTLYDVREGWPSELTLDGCVYNNIFKGSPTDSVHRLEWLNLQNDDKYLPQPYEQLAKVLKEMGHENDARDILIAKQEDAARLKSMTIDQKAWHYIKGYTIGYGYKPGLAVLWIIGFVVIGTVVFRRGYSKSQFTDTHGSKCTEFNAFIYSLDSFAPLIDLHQAKYLLPTSRFLRGYLWFHIICGWILFTLLVASLTGLIRQ